jgi:HSP20 family protein
MQVVRSRIETVVLPLDAAEFASELRHIFSDLGRARPEVLGGECSPSLDVFETDDALEIAVDLPGVSLDSVRVVARGQALLVAGIKAPRRTGGDASFHLVERGFGRFARVVRLAVPCDASRATATLHVGELRVRLPKIDDRRGHAIAIPVTDVPRRP